ncbi:MAG: DUF4347 domain-containing protein [Leptolyngbya sp. BL-A-14]
MNFVKSAVLSDALKTAPISGSSLPSALETSTTSALTPVNSWSGASGASAIAFIDGSVADYQTLVAGIAPGTEVHILNSSQDAVTQITNTLLGRHNISSVHIVSHGEAGGLDFGTGRLNLSDLPEYAAQLQSWSNALTDNADILLYGCDVAQGELGKTFTKIFSQLTGADVAASDNLTGSSTLHGDWTLEYQTGKIEASTIASPYIQAIYNHVLSVSLPGYTESVYVSALGTTGSALTIDTSTGTLYFADRGDSLYKVAPNKTVSIVNPSFTGGFFPYVATDIQYGTGYVYSSVGGNLYQVNTATGASTSIANLSGLSGNEDGIAVNGNTVYITSGNGGTTPGQVVQYSLTTNTTSTAITGTPASPTNIKYDAVANKFYFAASPSGLGSGVSFYQANPTAGTFSALSGSTSGGYGRFAIDPSGQFLYSRDLSGNVNRISTVDGAVTTFETGLSTTGFNGLAFGSSSSGNGFSLYVMDDARILEVSGFAGSNAAPTISFSGTSLSYIENAPATLIDSTATVADSDSANFDTGTLTANFSANGTVDDRLAINNQGTGAGQIGVSGSNVTYEGNTIGTFTGGVGTTPLIVTFNSNSSPAAAEALLRNLTYSNVSDAPSTSDRTLSVVLTDGDGGTSTTANKTISVTAVNDAPSFTKGTDQISTAGAGAQTITNWATGFNPGPDETSQTVQAYIVTVDTNPGIFAVAPAIDAFGNLTYTPAINVATPTTATISVKVQDNGGTANGGIDTSAVQTFTITVKPQPTISITPVSQNEGNSGTTIYTFTASLSDTSTQTVSVNYATADSTATVADGDYSAASGTLTFAPGDTSKTFTVNVSGDNKYENTEAFLVNLSNAVNGAIANGSTSVDGTITNDDTVPLATITPTVTQSEGNSGTTPYTFTVTLSNPSFEAIGINYSTSDGSATVADGDYTAATGTVNFASGETSKTITVNANGDTKFESDESFQLALTGPANGSGSVSPGNTITGTGTITNDDAQPTIGISSVAQNEGNSGTTAYTFTVSLSNASAQTVSVNYATADGTATVTDSDYVAASGTLSFAPGQTSKSITVLVNGDTKFEADQTFSVGLSNASNGKLGTSTGTGTITNDDSRPTISINNVSHIEGLAGTTAYTFAVNLSNTSDEVVTVNYATADGTATVVNNDYTATSGILTFNPTETSKTLTVNANGDARKEADETFQVNLATPTNGTIATGTGTGTIVNDDNTNLVWRSGTTGTSPTGTGEVAIWQLNGFAYQSGYYLPTLADLNWQIVSRADFNGDGNTDLLWRNRTTGLNAIWEINNSTAQSTYYIPSVSDLNWQIINTGDFNGDGKPDILWRNRTTGENAIWRLNGSTLQSGYYLSSLADPNWQIADTADFNNDGTTDILWRNRVTGENAVWQVSNFSRQSAYYIPGLKDQNWQIAGAGDFNQDGIADIVWRNKETGSNAIWQMNSTGFQSGYYLSAATTAWQIAGISDFNGDGTADILWRNQQSGKEEIWQMNGFSYSQTYQLPDVSRDWIVKTLPLP